jgi:hypothetical protein
MIVTIPIGWNDDLDEHLRRGTVKFGEQHCLKRVSADNRWAETDWDDIAHAKYGVPFAESSCHMLFGIERAPSTNG